MASVRLPLWAVNRSVAFAFRTEAMAHVTVVPSVCAANVPAPSAAGPTLTEMGCPDELVPRTAAEGGIAPPLTSTPVAAAQVPERSPPSAPHVPPVPPDAP